jgi:hypothetical protein
MSNAISDTLMQGKAKRVHHRDTEAGRRRKAVVVVYHRGTGEQGHRGSGRDRDAGGGERDRRTRGLGLLTKLLLFSIHLP